ncbi:MAG TPA: hypothetical protein VL984_02520 [Acidimicrobiales bacterium]|nr:hypothetical protein [Acidimicrobiales bacterium]
MAPPQLWARATVAGGDGEVLYSCELLGEGVPGVGALDEIGRLALAARRAGAVLRLTEVVPQLVELLELSALPVEVER